MEKLITYSKNIERVADIDNDKINELCSKHDNVVSIVWKEVKTNILGELAIVAHCAIETQINDFIHSNIIYCSPIWYKVNCDESRKQHGNRYVEGGEFEAWNKALEELEAICDKFNIISREPIELAYVPV